MGLPHGRMVARISEVNELDDGSHLSLIRDRIGYAAHKPFSNNESIPNFNAKTPRNSLFPNYAAGVTTLLARP